MTDQTQTTAPVVGAPPAPPQLSPDGQFWWTGEAWIPTAASPQPAPPMTYAQPAPTITPVAAVPPVAAQPVLEPITGEAAKNRKLLLGVGALVVVAAVGGAAGFALLSSKGTSGPTYAMQASAAVTPVVQGNTAMKTTIAALAPGADKAAALTALKAAAASVTTAQTSLAALKPKGSEATEATALSAALTSEQAWLTAAQAVLADPNSPQLSQLSSLSLDAVNHLKAVHAYVAGASTSFPDSTPVIAYAQAATKASDTKSALVAFNGQVETLLQQSAPAFQKINDLFNNLENVVNGGYSDVSIAQAEQIITTVIANRTSLAASARTIAAPTQSAKNVRADLVAAFDASLTNDQQIADCLNQENYGTIAYIYSSCLSASSGSSQTATDAKTKFYDDYNKFRAAIGKGASTAKI